MNITPEVLQLLDEEKWIDYINYMMIRNDWLQDNGKESEYEIYLITSIEYGPSEVKGIFQSVRGLDIQKIQKWFYKQIILEANKNVYYPKTINSNQLTLYLRNYPMSIEDDFVKYLVEKLEFVKLDIKETNLYDTNINNVLKEMKESEQMDK